MKILTTIGLGLLMLTLGAPSSALPPEMDHKVHPKPAVGPTSSEKAQPIQKVDTAPSGVPDRSGNVHRMGDGKQMRKNEPMGKEVNGAEGKGKGAGGMSMGKENMAAQMQTMKDHSKKMAGMTDQAKLGDEMKKHMRMMDDMMESMMKSQGHSAGATH